jgi:hypothetical protein
MGRSDEQGHQGPLGPENVLGAPGAIPCSLTRCPHPAVVMIRFKSSPWVEHAYCRIHDCRWRRNGWKPWHLAAEREL